MLRNPQFEIGHWLVGSQPLSNGTPKPPNAAARRSPALAWRVLLPLFRVCYWVFRFFSWGRSFVHRRFERAGLGLAASLAVAMVMVPDTENNVAYQGFALLLFLVLLGFAFMLVFPGRFSASRQLPRFATVGCPLSYTVTIQNLTRKTQNGLRLLEDVAVPRPSFAEWLQVQLADERRLRSFRFSKGRRASSFKSAVSGVAVVTSVAPGRKLDVPMHVTPLRRGLLHFSGVTVARPDPLGLVRAFTRLTLPQTLLVLPKRYFIPPIALPGALKYQQGGVALASNVGQSEEFVALRDYRHGDPLRHIHWRTWAKAGRPVVKEFEDEFFVRHALVLDTFGDHPRGPAFEEAISVAASFACAIQTQESLLDLLFVGPESYCFTSGRGLAHADQMLEILAMVRACTDQPFRNLEHLVLNHIQAVSGCICVLLAWDDQRREFVRKLQLLGVPLLVLVIVEAGEVGQIVRRPDDPERFHVLETGQLEKALLDIK